MADESMSVTGLMSMITNRMWSPISSRRFLEKATFSRTNCLMDSMLAKKMGAAGEWAGSWVKSGWGCLMQGGVGHGQRPAG